MHYWKIKEKKGQKGLKKLNQGYKICKNNQNMV